MNQYTSRWSPAEEKFLLSNAGKMTIKELQKAMGRSYKAIETKGYKLGLDFSKEGVDKEVLKEISKKLEKSREGEKKKKEVAKLEHTTLLQDREKAKERFKEEEFKRNRKKLEELLKEKTVEQQLRDDFREHLESDKYTINIGAPELPKNLNREAVDVMLVISDTHCGKIVRKEEVNNLGEYNPKIFLHKLAHLEKSVVEILTKDHACKTLHIALLGDLIDGCLAHNEEIPSRTYLVQQIQLCALALFQFIGRLSRIVPNIKVYGLGGNHSRLQNQKRPPTTGRWSNYDQVVLDWLQSLLNNPEFKNVKVDFQRSAYQIIDIAGWRFCCSHGDELRGGDKAMGIPVHSILRNKDAISSRLVASGQKAPDYYIIGDKHKPFQLPTATGEFICNGAWPSIDGYAHSGGFSPNRSQQILFGIHKDHGRSWSYNLYLPDPITKPKYTYNLPQTVETDLEDY